MALMGIQAALGGSQLLMKVLFIGAIAAGGFAAGEVYEHTAPWGLEHQRDKLRDSIPSLTAKAHDAGLMQQMATDRDAFDKWDVSLKACEASRVGAVSVAATAMDTQAKITDLSRTAAYRLGQASCGAPNAGNVKIICPPGGCVSGTGPVGVPVGPSLADILAPAAYSPRPR